MKISIGVFAALLVFVVGFAAILFSCFLSPLPSLGKREKITRDVKPILIPFDLGDQAISLPAPNLEGDMFVSFDRFRPDISMSNQTVVTVRLKKSGQMRRVVVPARLDLANENGLSFSDQKSSFWIELQQAANRQIQIQVFVADGYGFSREAKRFFLTAEESPIRSPLDFAEGSPYRILAESRLLGRDLFAEKYGESQLFQRLQIGSSAKGDVIVVKEGDFLSWIEGKWKKIGTFLESQGGLIAKIASFDDRSLLLEVWGLDEYLRFSVSSSQQSTLKTKGDEFLSSVRVRSEKQMSCMLDKQCFVLRVNDWVLKQDNRWKVLRKSEEKDAFIQGKVGGEIFVFDRIDAKGGQKTVHGYLFNSDRSQMFPVDVTAQLLKKQMQDRKGKGK